MNKNLGVIGVGNPLRRDDGIGITLLQKIKENVEAFPDSVSFLDGGIGGMNLLYIFDRFDTILLIDAVDFKAQPGSTRFFSLDEIKSQKQISTISTHNADLFQIIRFGQEFDECPKKIFVYGIQPCDLSFGEGLTKQVEKRINEMVSELRKYIKKLLETES